MSTVNNEMCPILTRYLMRLTDGGPIGFQYDYMGAAEYEFGAPRASRYAMMLEYLAGNIIATETYIDWSATYTQDKTPNVWIIYHPKWFTMPKTLVSLRCKETPWRDSTIAIMPLARFGELDSDFVPSIWLPSSYELSNKQKISLWDKGMNRIGIFLNNMKTQLDSNPDVRKEILSKIRYKVGGNI